MKRNTGFTLVEVLISISLFSVLVTIAVGGFAQALRSQRQATLLIAANSNVSEVIEQIAREIRTGTEFCLGAGFSRNGVSYDCTSSDVLIFTNIRDETVRYERNAAAGTINREVTDTAGTVILSGPVTADNVFVEYLDFVLSGNNFGNTPDGSQTRITIALGIRPQGAGMTQFVTGLQTTISPRGIDN